MESDEIDARIRLSACRLREWQWLAELSTAPNDVVALLRHEAREMIELGLGRPQKAKTIGTLVVGYNQLIMALMSSPETDA